MVTDNDYFKGLVRDVRPEDRNQLMRLSYSGLDLFKSCPYQYDLKYNKKMRPNETTLAMELGTLCHKVLECKCDYISQSNAVDYEYLYNVLEHGTVKILGLEQLRKKYWEEWYVSDNASGMNYEDKIKIFKEKVLSEEMSDISIWRPVYAELPFEFVYKDKVIFNGFIDRVDENVFGDYKTSDYKTSKKSYSRDKTATSLQFGIYALAIYNMFGKLPVKSEYRFVLIDEIQEALTKGWEKRLEKNLDNTLANLMGCGLRDEWIPKGSPLCYFCPFCQNNPKAKQYKNECEYYCLWTPNKRTFDVNRLWQDVDKKKGFGKIEVDNSKLINGRKLVF